MYKNDSTKYIQTLAAMSVLYCKKFETIIHNNLKIK